jgi:chromosomal replication initiation ATPase DnaA
MTENQKHLFNIDIDEYRKHVLKKYGIPIHIIFSIDAEKTEKVERLTFNAIQKSILEIMKIYNPEFIKHWRSKSAPRIPEFTVYYNIFTFFCKNAGYSYTSIGNYISRTHGTIIHQFKTANNRLSTEDPLFMRIYTLINKDLKKYVGTISKNTNV